ATSLTATAFALLLAASDGWSAVVRPVIDPTEYWAGVAGARPAGRYLRTFIEHQKFYSVHVRGHPPGFMLLLFMLRWAGLGGPWFAAALSYVGVGVAVAAVAFTVWRVAGVEAMRRSLPFLALAPFAVWQGTSADAFFAGVAATGVALLALAMTSGRRRIEIAGALAGGAVLGLSGFLTFGTPTLVPLVAVLAWKTRRIAWAVPALVGVALVVGAFAVNGYWWLDGLANTRHFYREGTAQFRPAFYFLFANVAVLAIALGPVTLAGLTRLARSPSARIVVGALVCVLVADFSGLSKAETERIWLLYMPWLAVAAGFVTASERGARCWLGIQAAAAIVVQVALVSKW
ncbi:MAG: hypothetical protein ABJD24_00840, partial [Acidimicrobiales bacterium]